MLMSLVADLPDLRSAGLAVAALFVIASVAALWRMRRRLRRLTAVLDHLPQGVCVFDASERMMLCNPRYIELYEISPAAVKPGDAKGVYKDGVLKITLQKQKTGTARQIKVE